MRRCWGEGEVDAAALFVTLSAGRIVDQLILGRGGEKERGEQRQFAGEEVQGSKWLILVTFKVSNAA